MPCDREPDIEHALRLVDRMIERLDGRLDPEHDGHRALRAHLSGLARLLLLRDGEDDPEDPATAALLDQAQGMATAFVDGVVAFELGGDRLGQNVRNLFECLGAATLGAEQSLRAGEDPDSLLRP